MTAQELRVGNCLQRNDGSVITVKRLIQNDNVSAIHTTKQYQKKYYHQK